MSPFSHNKKETSTYGPMDEVRSRFYDVIRVTDAHLMQYPLVAQVSSTVGLRPSWIPVAALTILSMIFGLFDNLISSIIGFFYPAWQSFKAIESPTAADDKQWLTYWVVYTFFSFVEIFGDILLFWIPFYYLVKVVVLLWLFLPQFKGASVVYARIIRPVLLQYENNIDSALGQISEGSESLVKEIAKNK